MVYDMRTAGYHLDTSRPSRPFVTDVNAASAHLPQMASVFPFPPVLDQGASQACTGFAASVLLDVAARKQGKIGYRSSPRGLWTLGRYDIFGPGEPLQNSGAHFRAVFEQAMKFGAIREDECPWDLDRLNEDIGFDGLIAGQGERLRVEGWYGLEETGDRRMTDIMSAINQGYAVGGAWKVTKNFCELGNEEVFGRKWEDSHLPKEPLYKHHEDTSDWAGNHAMSLIAYVTIDWETYFLAQNSWGLGFGYQGRCLFHRDFVDEAWDLTVVRAVP